jgi:hypothetical protein
MIQRGCAVRRLAEGLSPFAGPPWPDKRHRRLGEIGPGRVRGQDRELLNYKAPVLAKAITGGDPARSGGSGGLV